MSTGKVTLCFPSKEFPLFQRTTKKQKDRILSFIRARGFSFGSGPLQHGIDIAFSVKNPGEHVIVLQDQEIERLDLWHAAKCNLREYEERIHNRRQYLRWLPSLTDIVERLAAKNITAEFEDHINYGCEAIGISMNKERYNLSIGFNDFRLSSNYWSVQADCVEIFVELIACAFRARRSIARGEIAYLKPKKS